MRLLHSEHAGATWRWGILATIVVLGVLIIAMIIAHPIGAPWLWGLALTVYIPGVLLLAVTIKCLLLMVKRWLR